MGVIPAISGQARIAAMEHDSWPRTRPNNKRFVADEISPRPPTNQSVAMEAMILHAFVFLWRVILCLLIGATVAIVLLIAGLAARIHLYNHWYVEPTAGGKWRQCLTEFGTGGAGTGCSSPMAYDDALWWTETRGGTRIKP